VVIRKPVQVCECDLACEYRIVPGDRVAESAGATVARSDAATVATSRRLSCAIGTAN
jgi:hypothetical protein